MPRGDSLKAVNEERKQQAAEKSAQVAEAETAVATSSAVEVPMGELGPEIVTEFPTEDLIQERDAHLALIEQLKAENAALKAGGAQSLSYPTGRPLISKPLPKNYAVWLGPEPAVEDPDGGFRTSAFGTVHYIPDTTAVQAKDGDGSGKDKMVSRTKHNNIVMAGTGNPYGYVRAGREDIHFQYRLPANHRYPGKLYAEMRAPEHAAWLQLTAGMDRDKNPMFSWYLQDNFRHAFDQLRKSHMRRMQDMDNVLCEIMSTGATMPSSADANQPFQ